VEWQDTSAESKWKVEINVRLYKEHFNDFLGQWLPSCGSWTLEVRLTNATALLIDFLRIIYKGI